MPHRFEYEKAHLLDSEQRRKFFPPEKVLGILEGVRIKRDVAFDIGAGTGYLTIPLAKIFKKVYAVEISSKMIEILSKKIKENGILNVGIILSKKPPQVDFEIDLVVFSNVLHEMDSPEEYLCWAKIADYVLIAEWKKIEMEFGPPIEDRLSLEDVLSLCRDYEVVKITDLPYHYVALLKKRDRSSRLLSE
ncbi:MAG: class I SAM-dependent methyltransferase [Archaeoglobaceae archaeon]